MTKLQTLLVYSAAAVAIAFVVADLLTLAYQVLRGVH